MNQCPRAPKYSIGAVFEFLVSVLLTPAINPCQEQGRYGGGGAAKDRRKLKGTNRRYLRPSMSDMAPDGVIGTAIRRP
jgi:hypothetical protein